MDEQTRNRSLWQIAYGPPSKRKEQPLPGPLFDMTVIFLGIVFAVGYLLQ